MGPDCRVLVPLPFDEVEVALLEAWMDRVGCRVLQREWDDDDQVLDYDLALRDGSWIDAPYRGGERILWLGVVPPEREADCPELEQILGWRPEAELEIGTQRGQPEDHLLLAGMAATLAEKYGGLIDFEGAFTPPVWAAGAGAKEHQPTWEEVHAYVSMLPGRIHTLLDPINDEVVWFRHIGDAAWRRAWMEHPDFHLIK